jgi:hypothetical protein
LVVGRLMQLDGGACELTKVTLRRRGDEYYRATLEFSNGQSVAVPLYLPIVDDGGVQESKAMRLATEIGESAARSGEVDHVGWALDGRIPLRAYLQQRLRDAIRTGNFPDGVRFTTHFMTGSPTVTMRGLCITLFNGSQPTKTSAVYVNVPSEFAAPDLMAFLDDAIDETFGREARRHRLKSSGGPVGSSAELSVIRKVPVAYLQDQKGMGTFAEFVPASPGRRFNCSLGTTNVELAADRLTRLNAFIEQSLRSAGHLTVADIKRHASKLAAEPDESKTSARINRDRTGPVIVYGPTESDSKSKPNEALRVYTAVVAKPNSGVVFRTVVVGPSGRGTDGIYAAAFSIPKEHYLSMEQIEVMRSSLREFLHVRLSSFFLAGGKFRDREDIGFGPNGKPALTPAGAEKFRRILEGRLSTEFVDNCLKAAIANPFDSNLSPSIVQRMGGFATFPQPAHRELQLQNPRLKPTEKSPAHIRATLVWKNNETGNEHLRQNVDFDAIEELLTFVHAIDEWTTSVTATTGKAALPPKSGTVFLRRLCADYSVNRSP